MNNTIDKARIYAQTQHKGQIRKGDGKDYFTHPEAVYNIAKDVTNDVNILSACYLHDTIEDTPTTYEDLAREFGSKIADIVMGVTEDKSIKDWHSRKADYLKNVISNHGSIIVAWADKMHNTANLKTITDYSVFNVPFKDKLKFVSDFAKLIPQKELRDQLIYLLTTIDK